MNNQEQLSPELERVIKQVRLKEPPSEFMADYLAGVNSKIDRGVPHSQFGFPQIAMVLAIGLVMAGVAYFYFGYEPRASQVKVIPDVSISKPLSVEEEMMILEAFSEELADGTGDPFGDDEILEELWQLEEIEFLGGPSAQTSRI
ncbi:MAG: hypothetical protein HY585_03690 [Candidatus Omnitrophica bacterium]|nr:hypothetical protein [Candidatus Omnitrophota bacterium]